MPTYRVYELKSDGHIKGPPTDFDAADDKSAIAFARQLFEGSDIDLWRDDSRIVAPRELPSP